MNNPFLGLYEVMAEATKIEASFFIALFFRFFLNGLNGLRVNLPFNGSLFDGSPLAHIDIIPGVVGIENVGAVQMKLPFHIVTLTRMVDRSDRRTVVDLFAFRVVHHFFVLTFLNIYPLIYVTVFVPILCFYKHKI